MKNVSTPVFARVRMPKVRDGWRVVLLAGLVPLLVVGCGNKNIDLVKAEMVPNGNYTYGQILDNNKSCEDKSWKAFKDDKQREMVSFTCSVGIPDSLISEAIDGVEGRLQESRKLLMNRYAEHTSQSGPGNLQEECVGDMERIAKARSRLLRELADMPNPVQLEYHPDRLKSLDIFEAKLVEHCEAEQERRKRAFAHMEKIKPDYMAALEAYIGEKRKQTEAYYRQKRPTTVNLQFVVQGQDVRRASSTLDIDGENLSLVGQYMIAVFLGPDDTRLPKLLMEKVEMERDHRVKAQFPFTCDGLYCDRDKAFVENEEAKPRTHYPRP